MAQFAKCELRPVGLLYRMLFRSGFQLLGSLTLGALLVGGCGTPSRSHDGPPPGLTKAEADGAMRRIDPETLTVEAHAHYATALVHELNGESDLALQAFYEAAVRDIENESLILEVSRRLIQSKQSEKALELLKRATARPGASGNLFARLGFIQFQLGKPAEAIAANRIGVRRAPRTLVGYQNLFLIYLQTGKQAEAFAVLDDAAKVSKTDAEFLLGLGEMYANYAVQVPAKRDIAHERGKAVLERAAKLNPGDPQLKLRLADAFNMFGQTEAAAGVYRSLLGDFDDVPFVRDSIRAKLTELYLRGRETAQAAEQLESLIRENPTDAQAHYTLGTIRYGETNFALAAESFSKVIVLNPGFEQAYYDLAAAQLNEGKIDAALMTLQQARQRFPQRFFAEYLSGIAFTQRKDYTNALAHFTAAEVIAEAAAKAGPMNQLKDSFYFQLGATCERVGDYVQAEKYFEKCLELSPNHHEAQNYLGYMLAERGEKLDRAKGLIERALVAEPDNAAYLDSMGWVLFKLNRHEEALKHLLEAVAKSEEEDATVYDHVGDAYQALNQIEKAREFWKKSLAVEENEAVRRKLESNP